MRRIVVVGAGLAGVSSVRALRAQGFTGEIVQVGEEPHAPYDRPPLSKEFLAGEWGSAELALTGPDDAELDVDLRLGVAVRSVDPAARIVQMADGRSLTFDGLVIATGARARLLPAQRAPGAPVRGVHTLRTLDDAVALRASLAPGARLVVVGAGFLGAEVASTARARGCEVSVVEAAEVPFADVFGAEAGRRCAGLHGEHGVRLFTGARVAALQPAEDLGADGEPVVGWVELDGGRRLAADVVLVAVGAVPAVEWLAGSGIPVDGGVLVDASGRTSVDGVVAVGDCAAQQDPSGRPVAGQHWTDALQAPVLGVAALLGTAPLSRPATAALPYVWSHQYGVMIQFAGRRRADDVLHVVEGDLASAAFVGLLGPPGLESSTRSANAVLAMNSPRSFGRLRKQVAAAKANGEGYVE